MIGFGRQSEGTGARDVFPRFEPHPLVRGGHAQTIVGCYAIGPRPRLRSTYHEILLEDGDRLAVFDSRPERWRPGGPAAVVVHGLAGSARSMYVVRVAARFVKADIRVVRMNLRGAGAGFGAARRFYHGGKSEDVRAVVEWLAGRAPGSPIALVGFSLGGNLVLKLAAEATDAPVEGLDAVIAANPPLDLAACCRHIRRAENRAYDRYFVQLLRREVRRLHETFPELGPPELGEAGSLFDFDDSYTASRNGFAGAEDYYARCSAGSMLSRIAIPGLIVHAEDDPFIPPGPFRDLACPGSLRLELLPFGGHLGYVSRRRFGGDRRWLDARLTSWLVGHWRDHPAWSGFPLVPSERLATGDRSSEAS